MKKATCIIIVLVLCIIGIGGYIFVDAKNYKTSIAKIDTYIQDGSETSIIGAIREHNVLPYRNGEDIGHISGIISGILQLESFTKPYALLSFLQFHDEKHGDSLEYQEKINELLYSSIRTQDIPESISTSLEKNYLKMIDLSGNDLEYHLKYTQFLSYALEDKDKAIIEFEKLVEKFPERFYSVNMFLSSSKFILSVMHSIMFFISHLN